MSTSFRGIFPIVPTPFNEDGSLDLDSQKRVLDCMIDQGVDGLCILANYSEQFLLSDEERAILQELCLSYVNGRVPVIATCSHFSTDIAVARCQRAEEQGAAMVMMMPPYHGSLLKANDQGDLRAFRSALKCPEYSNYDPGCAFERCYAFRAPASQNSKRLSSGFIF